MFSTFWQNYVLHFHLYDIQFIFTAWGNFVFLEKQFPNETTKHISLPFSLILSFRNIILCLQLSPKCSIRPNIKEYFLKKSNYN